MGRLAPVKKIILFDREQSLVLRRLISSWLCVDLGDIINPVLEEGENGKFSFCIAATGNHYRRRICGMLNDLHEKLHFQFLLTGDHHVEAFVNGKDFFCIMKEVISDVIKDFEKQRREFLSDWEGE